MKKQKILILLDAHAILHRAYHALPDFKSKKGEPTGALYGFCTLLFKLIKEFSPEYIVACYDLPEKTYRHDAYKDYKAGRAEKLVITGDDGEFRANEMTPMLAYARSKGVPASAIVVDGHGYRTYESCYRGARFYGFKNVIAVSQRFHLPRIIFLCEHFGLHTVGFVADDNLPLSVQIKIEIREVLARVKNWIDVVVLPPKSPVNNSLRSEP
jgi:hypothetical protein